MSRSSSLIIPILIVGTATIAVVTAAKFQLRKSKDNDHVSESDGEVADDRATLTTIVVAQPDQQVIERSITLEENVVNHDVQLVSTSTLETAVQPENLTLGEKGADEQEAKFSFRPIGTVRSVYRLCVGTPRQGLLAPHARGQVELTSLPLDAVAGLEGFSHIWIVFCFHLNTQSKNEAKQPSKIAPPALGGMKVGVLATRSPHRPNPIGLTLCKLNHVRTKKVKNQLITILDVSGLDLVDETPVLDVKPYVPHYDTSDGHVGNTTLPSWVVDGLATQRKVTISTLAREQLWSVLQENPKALFFYGPHRGDSSVDETFHQVLKCIEEILSIDVRSSWQTQKARMGKSQAERANRLKDMVGEDAVANHEEDICTQQIDNLMIHFMVVEHQQTEEQRLASVGSGAEDSVHVKSIRLISLPDNRMENFDDEVQISDLSGNSENKLVGKQVDHVPEDETELEGTETTESQTNAEQGENSELQEEAQPTAGDESLLIAGGDKESPSAVQESVSSGQRGTKNIETPAKISVRTENVEDADYRSLKSFWSKQASQNTPTGLVPSDPLHHVSSRDKFFVYSDKPVRVKTWQDARRSGSRSPVFKASPGSVSPGTVSPPPTDLYSGNESKSTDPVTHDGDMKLIEKDFEKDSEKEVPPIIAASSATDNGMSVASVATDSQSSKVEDEPRGEPLVVSAEDTVISETVNGSQNESTTNPTAATKVKDDISTNISDSPEASTSPEASVTTLSNDEKNSAVPVDELSVAAEQAESQQSSATEDVATKEEAVAAEKEINATEKPITEEMKADVVAPPSFDTDDTATSKAQEIDDTLTNTAPATDDSTLVAKVETNGDIQKVDNGSDPSPEKDEAEPSSDVNDESDDANKSKESEHEHSIVDQAFAVFSHAVGAVLGGGSSAAEAETAKVAEALFSSEVNLATLSNDEKNSVVAVDELQQSPVTEDVAIKEEAVAAEIENDSTEKPVTEETNADVVAPISFATDDAATLDAQDIDSGLTNAAPAMDDSTEAAKVENAASSDTTAEKGNEDGLFVPVSEEAHDGSNDDAAR